MSFDAGDFYDQGTSFDDEATGPPIFGKTTMRMYSRYPESWLAADAVIAQYDPLNDFPLLRYLALIGDQASEVEALLDRFNYIPEWAGGPPGSTSDLVDPHTADAAWLPWLAQLVGVKLPPGTSVNAQRGMIAGASNGWQAGSRAAMIAAAQTQLTGAKFVQLVDHVDGDQWQMQIITRASESPSPDTVVSTIIATNNKPVGVQIAHLFYEASWDTIEQKLPSWSALEQAPTIDPVMPAGSWGAITETQPPANATWATIEEALTSWTELEAEGSWQAIETLGLTTGVITQIGPTTGLAPTTITPDFIDQLNVIGAGGRVTYTQTSGTSNLAVSPSGQVSTTGTLAAGTYTAGGTMADPYYGAGTFTYTLTVRAPATWAQIEADLADWNAWENAGSWEVIEAQA